VRKGLEGSGRKRGVRRYGRSGWPVGESPVRHQRRGTVAERRIGGEGAEPGMGGVRPSFK